MANIRITEQEILKALSKVQEPELRQDLVSLKMIRDIKINGKGVQFTIMLTTPACPLKAKIEAEARQAVMELGASTVEIRMDSSVRGDGMTRGLLTLPVRNVIAIASGKGGVGKSTVAVNMAVTLAQSGARVGLLDADIYGPNIPTMMGVDRLPPPNGNRLIPAEVYGVKLMSIGFLVKPGQPLIWRGPMLHSAIRQFLGDVEWGELDYLVVDLPPGTGDAQLSLSQSIPLSGGVLVTLPQQVSLEDASRSLAMFRELKVPVLGVVENMSYLTLPDCSRLEVFGNGGGEQLARMGGVDLMGKIPMDPAVRAGGDEGRPIVISDPESEAARVMRSVAEQTAAKLSVAAFQAEENAVGKAV